MVEPLESIGSIAVVINDNLNAFCEILSHLFCNKGRVSNQIVVSLIVLY